MTRLVAKPGPTYIRALFETAAPTSRLRRTRAQEDETILKQRHSKPSSWLGSSHLDPPGLIGSWKIVEFSSANASGGLHDRALDDDAGVDVFPQRDEQLAGERDNRCLPETAAVVPDPVLEPQGKSRSRLMAPP